MEPDPQDRLLTQDEIAMLREGCRRSLQRLDAVVWQEHQRVAYRQMRLEDYEI